MGGGVYGLVREAEGGQRRPSLSLLLRWFGLGWGGCVFFPGGKLFVIWRDGKHCGATGVGG